MPPQPVTTTAGGGGGDQPSFFSARAFKAVDPDEVLDPSKNNHLNPNAAKITAPKPGQAFNPHLQSPSIPRTPGVDHSASKPLGKSGKHVAPLARGEDEGEEGVAATAEGGGAMGNGPGRPAGAGAAAVGGRGLAGPGGAVNPQLDHARRIGAPAGAVSPLGNRGQFRPLTVKRPAGAAAVGAAGVGVARVPLENVSTNVVGGGGRGDEGGLGPDLKRQRTS